MTFRFYLPFYYAFYLFLSYTRLRSYGARSKTASSVRPSERIFMKSDNGEFNRNSQIPNLVKIGQQ
jgi:hypothetical protein